MGRKIKWQPSPPPLSALDKGIYAAVILLSIFGPLCAIYFLAEWIPAKIIFSDPSVIAGRNNAAYFSFWVIWCYIMVVGGVIPALAVEHKQPIFGNKNFKPKAGQGTIEVYPLFSKAFREHLSDKTKFTIKRTALVFAVILVVCALIVPLGYYSRTTLDQSYEVAAYNCFDMQTHRAPIEDADYMIIRITGSGRGGAATDRVLAIAFVYGDREYHFSLGEFEQMTTAEALEQMLHLKSLLNGRYEIRGEKWLDRLIAEQDFSAAETILVYELFDNEN